MSAEPRGIPPEGYRLPAATRPGRVRLQVADLDRSLAWYAEVLGLEPLIREEGTASLAPVPVAPAALDAAALDDAAPAPASPSTAGAGAGPAGSDDAILVELVERKGSRPVPPRGHLGLFHVAFLLPHRSQLGRFARHLAGLRARVGASDHLVSEAFYLHDPDGLGIEVYADRPRSEWRQRDREIVMATEPLDVDGLIAAAGGAPWKGMPHGTTVGHLHLRVGDLPRAEAFYHRALGLDRIVWSYPGALFLSAGGYHHHLGVNTWAGPVEPARDDEARLLEWELLVPGAASTRPAPELERDLEPGPQSDSDPEPRSDLATEPRSDFDPGSRSDHASELRSELERPARSLEAAGAPVERRPSENALVTRDPWGTVLRLRGV